MISFYLLYHRIQLLEKLVLFCFIFFKENKQLVNEKSKRDKFF